MTLKELEIQLALGTMQIYKLDKEKFNISMYIACDITDQDVLLQGHKFGFGIRTELLDSVEIAFVSCRTFCRATPIKLDAVRWNGCRVVYCYRRSNSNNPNLFDDAFAVSLVK